jgi:hypothetical protein
MPDLLQFKETIIDVEGGAEHTIGLKFSPVMKTGAAEVMVFINDEDDKNDKLDHKRLYQVHLALLHSSNR